MDDENNILFTRSHLQNKDLTLSLKSIINSILYEIENLEQLKEKQSLCCNYLSEIKSQVHSPLTNLLTKYYHLPSLQDTTELTVSANLLSNQEIQYEGIRSYPLFLHISQYKQEAEYLEIIINEMLQPLRYAAKTIAKLSSVRRESSVWSRVLLPLLACSTGELMARCCHQ